MARQKMNTSPVNSGRTISKIHLWSGRVLSGLAVVFFLVDGVMKLWKPAVVVAATRQLGYPESHIVGIGVLLTCTLLPNKRKSVIHVITIQWKTNATPEQI